MVKWKVVSDGEQAELVIPEGSRLFGRVFSRFISHRRTELKQRRALRAEVDDARDKLLGDAW